MPLPRSGTQHCPRLVARWQRSLLLHVCVRHLHTIVRNEDKSTTHVRSYLLDELRTLLRLVQHERTGARGHTLVLGEQALRLLLKVNEDPRVTATATGNLVHGGRTSRPVLYEVVGSIDPVRLPFRKSGWYIKTSRLSSALRHMSTPTKCGNELSMPKSMKPTLATVHTKQQH